jgi:methylthioribulose 1-phosphate dehydratase / enolase-phosphatase E1
MLAAYDRCILRCQVLERSRTVFCLPPEETTRVAALQAYEHRDAGAVMHSHSMNAVLSTLLDPAASEFRCTHLEMMKGISGHGFYDNLVVPIIENTARECELTERMQAAMLAYPKSNAVLVRRHGVYVWGATWIEAKTQAECYDYLFGIAVQMAAQGVDSARPPAPRPLAAAANGQADGGSGGVHLACSFSCCCLS